MSETMKVANDGTQGETTRSENMNPHTEPPKPKVNSEACGEQTSTSERKREANRENSQRSTGPKTEEGKRAVRLNALKHGFFANDVVIDGQESPEEFTRLLTEYRRYFEPVGAVEDQYVKLLAETDWRSRRLLRAEKGEIIKSTIGALPPDPLEQFFSSSTIEDVTVKLGSSSFGVGLQLKTLGRVREDVERYGFVSDELQMQLDRDFSGSGAFARFLRQRSKAARSSQEEAPEKPNNGALGEEHRAAMLASIDDYMGWLKLRRDELEAVESEGERARLLSQGVPSREAMEKTVRYETYLDRKREGLTQSLLKLQERRRAKSKEE